MAKLILMAFLAFAPATAMAADCSLSAFNDFNFTNMDDTFNISDQCNGP